MPKKGEKGPEGQKRIAITDVERQHLRFHHNTNPNLNQQSLAVWFEGTFGKKIGQPRVFEILSDKYKYLDKSIATSAKRNRRKHYEALEIALHEWSKTQDHVLTNKELKNQGEIIWRDMAKPPGWKDQTPTFSDGWLSKWRKSYILNGTAEIEVCESFVLPYEPRDLRATSFLSTPFQPRISSHAVMSPSIQSALSTGISSATSEAGMPSYSKIFSSSSGAFRLDASQITELQEPVAPRTLVPEPQITSNPKKRKIDSRLQKNKICSTTKSTLKITIEISPQSPFDSKTCDSIVLLTCQSVVNHTNVYHNKEIMQIFAPIIAALDNTLCSLQNLSRQYKFQKEAIPQVRQRIKLLLGAEKFEVQPAVQLHSPSHLGSNLQIWDYASFNNSSEKTTTGEIKNLSNALAQGLTVTGGSLDIAGGRIDIQSWVNRKRMPAKSTAFQVGRSLGTKITVTPPPKTQSVPQVFFYIPNTRNNTPVMPTISFRNLVPKNSEIFRIAREGTVSELRNALDTGVGSVNDYDGRWSVAMCAMLSNNYDILRFLLPYIDINMFESYTLNLFTEFCIASAPNSNYDNANHDEVTTLLREMLNLGADPSLPISLGEKRSIIALCVSKFNVEQFKLVLNNTGPFESPLLPDKDIKPVTCLLLEHCESIFFCLPLSVEGMNQKIKVLLYLLNCEADVSATTQNGETCLHLVLRNCYPHEFYYLSNVLRDVLLLLVAAGADIFAVDNNGNSISHVAWKNKLEELWRSVLVESGYNITEVISLDEKARRYLWNSNFERCETPYKEGFFFMPKACMDQPTQLRSQDYAQNSEHRYPFIETGSEDPGLRYWFDIEDDSDSDYENFDGSDKWENDYEAEEKYTSEENWRYYQHPVKAEAYPNRYLERKRLGIPNPSCGERYRHPFYQSYLYFS